MTTLPNKGNSIDRKYQSFAERLSRDAEVLVRWAANVLKTAKALPAHNIKGLRQSLKLAE
jgi:hypothetical protein